MPGVEPLPPEEIENYEEFAAGAIARMGFVVNSTKTMARRPEIREAFGRLFVSVFGGGEVDASLKHMVAQVVSVAAATARRTRRARRTAPASRRRRSTLCTSSSRARCSTRRSGRRCASDGTRRFSRTRRRRRTSRRCASTSPSRRSWS